jgi:hypothetical protein
MIQYIIYVISILGNKIITNNNNILYNTVSYSFYSIKFIYNYLSQNDSNNLQEFIKSIISDEFMIKLKLVENWLKIYNPNAPDSNKKIVYEMISNNCKIITNTIIIIDTKINEHNQKWLNNWRNIDISKEITLLKETIINLDNNIKYIYSD